MNKDNNPSRMELNEELRESPHSSPYQSLGKNISSLLQIQSSPPGDRPEMELDLWEGQFNLSSLQGLVGLEDEEFSRGPSCWAEDSVVTMGTVSHLKLHSCFMC